MRSSLIARVAHAIVVCAVLVVFLFPVLWIVHTSFKPAVLVFNAPPVWLFSPTLSNYAKAWNDFDVPLYLKNSAIITAGSTALSLLLGVPAAYGIARSRARLMRPLLNAFLVVRMAPPIAMLLPFYLLMRDLHLLGSYLAVIIISTALNSAFVVWMLYGSFSDLPISVEEAAFCDGCSRFQAFWRVALPLARPAIITSALFCMLFAWNDFIFALLLTSPETKTLPVALLATFSSLDINWGELAVLSEITILPVVVAAILLNRKLVSGLTAGIQ